MYNQLSFPLYISNYLETREADTILNALSQIVYRHFNAWPTFSNISKFNPPLDGFRVDVKNYVQYEAVLAMNGALIFNYPIWIIKLPNGPLSDLSEYLLSIIHGSASDGSVDLTNLAARLDRIIPPDKKALLSIVDFNARDFVEFFLFMLGKEAKDRKFLVSSLFLGNNGIEFISNWTLFFYFLPNLRYLNVRNNPLREIPRLLQPFQHILIDFDTAPNQNQQYSQFQNNQFPNNQFQRNPFQNNQNNPFPNNQNNSFPNNQNNSFPNNQNNSFPNNQNQDNQQFLEQYPEMPANFDDSFAPIVNIQVND